MGPISAEAMGMAGVLDRVIHVKPGESYLLLASGPLRVAHLTDHLPLRDVSALIAAELITRALHQLNAALRQWGIAQPRIAVAGFNPHAKGLEDETQIAPGVAQARVEGIDVVGPVSPDTVFRQGIEGRYDLILAMYISRSRPGAFPATSRWSSDHPMSTSRWRMEPPMTSWGVAWRTRRWCLTPFSPPPRWRPGVALPAWHEHDHAP
jgi:hypothetical protein